MKNEMYREALRDFEVVVGIEENYPDIYYYRGMSKVYLGKEGLVEDALQDFFKAI